MDLELKKELIELGKKHPDLRPSLAPIIRKVEASKNPRAFKDLKKTIDHMHVLQEASNENRFTYQSLKRNMSDFALQMKDSLDTVEKELQALKKRKKMLDLEIKAL